MTFYEAINFYLIKMMEYNANLRISSPSYLTSNHDLGKRVEISGRRLFFSKVDRVIYYNLT